MANVRPFVLHGGSQRPFPCALSQTLTTHRSATPARAPRIRAAAQPAARSGPEHTLA